MWWTCLLSEWPLRFSTSVYSSLETSLFSTSFIIIFVHAAVVPACFVLICGKNKNKKNTNNPTTGTAQGPNTAPNAGTPTGAPAAADRISAREYQSRMCFQGHNVDVVVDDSFLTSGYVGPGGRPVQPGAAGGAQLPQQQQAPRPPAPIPGIGFFTQEVLVVAYHHTLNQLAEQSPPTESAPMFELVNKYCGEFAEVYGSLSRQSSELADGLQQKLLVLNAKLENVEPKLKFYRKEMVDSLQSQDPVIKVPTAGLLPIFSWAVVLHLGYFVASIFGATLFYPFVALVFGRFSASILVYVLLPAYAFYYLSKAEKEFDKEIRFRLLAVTMAQGVLVGFLFFNRHIVTIQPLCFVSDLAVAVSAAFLAPLVGSSRVAVLGAMAGSVFVAHFAVGIVLGQLSFPYVLMAVLYSVIAYSTLQFYLKFQSDVSPYAYMIGTFVASLYVELLVVLIFGISYKESN